MPKKTTSKKFLIILIFGIYENGSKIDSIHYEKVVKCDTIERLPNIIDSFIVNQINHNEKVINGLYGQPINPKKRRTAVLDQINVTPL